MHTSIIVFSAAFMAATSMAKPIVTSDFDPSSTFISHEPYTSLASGVFTPVPSPAHTSIVSEPLTSVVSEPATAVETNVTSVVPSAECTHVVSSVILPVSTNVFTWVPPPASRSTLASEQPIFTSIVNSTSTLTSSAELPWPTSNNTTHNSTRIITSSLANYTATASANGTDLESSTYTFFESAPTPSAI
ncbi:unnamed protein product [Rhizoctonia solani]|uniref:Uncharacterized protein n=1 Tax=Rhizoctonia solani TaxID=456999 RepID=A0A8H7IJS4_9AGAM|nr:hypothetical protein RHS04_04273 [Rhizoctonia solani]KAF8761159.1 hypothetical protein RHS01_00669 [Rhizoctonia solani]CAE6435488.1 unnamed protein product [Rhizoctonia solani]